MPSFIRRMRKRGLKAQGFHREGPERVEVGANGIPYIRKLKKAERMILDADGKSVGPHYPR